MLPVSVHTPCGMTICMRTSPCIARTTPRGPQPLTGTDFAFNIQGVAPYWRLAWQQTWGPNYLAIGTYGMYVSSVPGGVAGLRDTYSDSAIDLQFERPFGINLLSLHTTYVHETSNLNGTFAAGGAATPSHHLNTFRADATYHLRRRYTFTLAAYSTIGSADSTVVCARPRDRQFAWQPQQQRLYRSSRVLAKTEHRTVGRVHRVGDVQWCAPQL